MLLLLANWVCAALIFPDEEMDGYPGVTGGDSTQQQERHYYLLSELQTLVKGLPRYRYFLHRL